MKKEESEIGGDKEEMSVKFVYPDASTIFSTPPEFDEAPNFDIEDNLDNLDTELVLIDLGSHVRVMKLINYLNYRDNHHSFGNTIVYNDYDNYADVYQDGHVVETLDNPDFDAVGNIEDRLTSTLDFITGENLSHIVGKKVGTPEVKVESTKIQLSANDIHLLRTCPPLYKKLKVDKIQTKLVYSELEIEEMFLFLSIYYPEQIPEYFSIIEKEPWSDLMKNYLSKLADLISAEMIEKDEIDNMEALEELAHKHSGYRESLESVRILAKDYNDYFRYCLVKDDKLLINTEKSESLIKLGQILRNLSIVKEVSLSDRKKDKILIREEYISGDIKDKPYLISAISDITKIDRNSGTIYLNIFKKIDKNLSEFQDNIIFEEELTNRMTILHEAITTSQLKYPQQVFSFIIVDKNNLCYVFQVKPNTIKKWKQKLYQQSDKAYWHIYNNRYDLPYEFAKEGVTI